jgi:hypothetical protein
MPIYKKRIDEVKKKFGFLREYMSGYSTYICAEVGERKFIQDVRQYELFLYGSMRKERKKL